MEVESWGIEKRGFWSSGSEGRRGKNLARSEDGRSSLGGWDREMGWLDCVSNETRGVRGGVRSRCMCFGETCFDVIRCWAQGYLNSF